MKLPIAIKKPTKRQLLRFLLNSLVIVLGNMLAAGASAFFIIPNNFVMGGTTGIGIFMRNLIAPEAAWREWVVSITVYTANILLFAIGAILLGKQFAVATFAGTLLYPTFISVFNLANDAIVRSLGAPLAASEPFLAVVCGAILFGLGIGIVVRVGASTGGTDIPPLIFHKFFNWPVSVTMWVLDMSIVAFQIIAAPITSVLYGAIITIISSLVIDKVAPIGMRRTQVKIVSVRYEEIRDMILNKISRGVTVLYGETGYLQNDCHMLLTVISQRQLVQLKAEVQRIDPEAFMTISIVSEVRGRGFDTEGVDFLMPQDKSIPPTVLEAKEHTKKHLPEPPSPSAEEE